MVTAIDHDSPKAGLLRDTRNRALRCAGTGAELL